jgi:hypothetical protein
MTKAEAQEIAAEALGDRLTQLLTRCGDAGTCGGCGGPVIWMTHKHPRYRKTPYDSNGVNHLVTCPAAEQLRGRYQR